MHCYSQAILRVLGLICLVVALPGCGLLKKGSGTGDGGPSEEPGAEGAEEGPSIALAGEIASVHKEEGFVLIRRFAQGVGFGEGNLVASQGPGGRTASLKVTGERLGRLYAADIQEGAPERGDLVTVRRLPESKKPASTALPEVERRGEEAPWMKNLPEPGL